MGDKVKKIKKISRQRINIPPDDGPEREDEIMGRAGSSKDTKDPKRKRPSRERWLLTRKTWRYMADAGRRLIPDGALNRPEDIPKIEAYFQEVCHKEPRFLLWRKCSYPGALGFRSHKKNRRDRKKGGSCREKACSADEVEDDKHLSGFALHKTSSGRFDIQKLRQEFLKGSSLSTPSSTPDYFSRHKFQKPFSEQKGYLPDLPEVAGFQTEEQSPESEEQEMMDTLLYLLNRGETKETGEENVSETKTVDYTKLLYQLRRYLSNYNLEAKDGSYLASNDNLEVVKSDGDEASEGDVAADSDALESDGSSRNVIGVSTTNSRGITTVVKTSDNEKSRNIGKSNNSLSDNNRSSSPGKTVNSGDKTSLNSGKTITSISGKVTNSRKNISSVKTTLEDQASKIKGTAPFFNDSKKHERNVGIKSRTKTIRDGDREDKSGIGWTSHLRNVGGKSSIDQAGSNDGPSRNVRDTGENKSGIVGSSSGSGLRATSRSPSSSSSPHRSSYSLKENIHFEGDNLQKLLVETLRRYYSKSSSREKVISDLLTDRKLLEKLYYDLRKARGFKGRSGAQVRGTEETQKKNDRPNQESGPKLRHVDSGVIVVGEDSEEEYDEPQLGSWKRLGKPAPRRPKDLPPFSPPPLIEIQHEIEPTTADKGVQTEPIPTNIMVAIEEEIKREREREENEERQTKLPTGMNRRRSSVDHDDVSQSVSDTIKRYLKMARKKSVDSDKADRFKRVNYDRNLRNIKAKGEITKPGDDDGLNKGCQTDETWTTAIKELKLDEIPISSDTECSPIIDDYSGSRITSSRSSFDGGVCDDTLLSPPAQVYGKPHSPGILSSGQSFLSNLLHGLQQQQQQQQSGVTSQPSSPVAAAGVTMQKSKSSSSVVHQGSRLVAKKIWRNRSKSQSRATTSATSAWTPQGQCTWSNVMGRIVTLADTTLLQLTEVERRVMQKVALAKLQALNLGVTVRIPSDAVGNSTAHKPKRRAYLLKRKALTTGFFDTARGKDGDKEKDGSSNATGLVFGIPISQCLENDRLLRNSRGESSFRSRSEVEEPSELCRKSHHGSRSSFSSLIETSVRADESGSCESLMSPTERMAGSVPGLLDTLSCGSAADISGLGERDPGIPHLVASCLRHIEEHGLHTLGIFRVSSSKKRVRQLREDFDCGKEISLDDDLCPHDVATLLKEFFRDLPEPLLCRDLYLAFVQTQRIRNRRLQFEALQHLIQLLPAANRDTLWALLNFLYIVARNSTDHTDEKGEWVSGNKMDSNNLATLFAPNILHCIKPGSTKEIIADSPEERIDVINVIRTMIDHNQQLFKVPADLLDEVYVHMMDSHPEALDHLLRKRDISTEEIIDDLESSATEAGSDSYFIPRTSASLGSDLHEILGNDEPRATPVRRVWSREEFLHESAAMGGPDVSMRPRHKDRDRGRDRGSKKRWRDEASSGGGSDSSSRITSSSGIAGSASSKTRSASVDSGNVTGHSGGGASDHSDATSRTLRAVPDELHDAGSRRQSTPVTMDGGGIITASLKIPVPGSTSAAFSLNLDDADIPYIEDGGGYSVTSEGRQHMTIGVVRPGVGAVPGSLTRRRRQRSASGSDSSSLASTPAYLPQQGYDPTATTPSVCSSVSSPPSWASSPPTSPDSNVTTVDYIPELPSRTKQKTVTLTTKEITPVILQKVMFTSTSELQQVQRGGVEREGTTNKSHSLGLPGELPKSASTSAMGTKRVEFECDLPARESAERKAATSISSIGGAVMRSKTADIERMLRIQKADQSLVGRGRGAAAPQQPPASAEEQDDKKKYSKRRYTDSRHQTRHIPDSDALREGPDSRPVVVIEGPVRQSPAQQVLVYKRRELIASDPKEHETFL